MGLGRRDFLKRVAAAQAGLALGASATAGQMPQGLAVARAADDVIVVGAGAFGGWTALYLARMGAKVTLVDAYGPATRARHQATRREGFEHLTAIERSGPSSG